MPIRNKTYTITADSETVEIDWGTGLGTFWATGTFDGATLNIETKAQDGTTWVALGAEAIMTTGMTYPVAFYGYSKDLRYRITGGSGSVNVELQISRNQP